VKHLRNEEGIALVLALSVLVVLGMLGTVVTTYATAGQRTASRSSSSVAAYTLAEAGINNAVSVLANPSNSPVNQSLLPSSLATANTTSYQGGYVKWWGTYDTASTTWTLSAIGYVRNPAGGSSPVTRSVSVRSKVRPTLMQPVNSSVWNYIIATRTGTAGGCDESLNNSVNIQSPLYVLGNLCLNTPSQITGGPLVVKGSMKLDVNTNVGSSAAPVNEVHVKYGCSYKNGAYASPCSPTQNVWAAVSDANPPELTIPTADYATWYLNAAPGPKFPCTTQSGTVPVFDNDTTFNSSVAGVFNLTPPSSDYSCVARVASKVVGELSWNHTTKLLTVNGTIFIDGSVTANYGWQNVPIRYTGQGTIYVGGTMLIKTTSLCATINATYDACDFATWNPNTTFLVFVANGNGGQVPTGDSIQLVSADFEGGLFATNAIELDTSSQSEGPMLGGFEVLDNTVFARTWPIISAPSGMPGVTIVYAQPDPPSGYSG
jgi:Tfp pilus assembly protein PilX